ncbi:hypothetical protein ACSCB1_17645 [Streptomyces europaeiscabiei]|uniref:hypothetical protein n=1 Tax=Streptomyces europaeiscabiei TaxID=146819 RepID=UPI0006285526|nr:hypothetical protein [Streptomyces europaeiscabiei]MDX2525679.1 hypothetical protein [Streptomyces europaeiscabiei]MDX2772869.1 hypothetical protein [Streptomyces europaeiscabiei]MDX3667577.1 hypothetical protein [Streptomyces europaeiscabiei]MDX3690914.1 hypothetical protein [Streptomyces europaeiscabiei]MDX3708585.1 hypothetical protein [Streptomyces europaeiscabiei]
MSFGDPNNPYGQPQQQPPAQGYGYPQQGPPQQPGYGYPAAPPVSQGYGGYPNAPETMPSTVNAARIMLWVIVGLQVIGVLLYGIGAIGVSAASDSTEDPALAEALGNIPVGQMVAIAIFAVAWLVYAIMLAVKFKSGGSGVRTAALVFGIITAILGIFPFLVIGLVHLVLGILIAVFVGNANGKAWFNRPRY